MKFIFFLLSVFSFAYSPLSSQELSPFSLYSFMKNGANSDSIEILKKSENFEIIREKSDENIYPDTKKTTLKIRLKNGLHAYLVSDPDLEKSAASLGINVGSWDDPKEAPGLAHFVEHLLFMGSSKYPSDSDFCRFINERGGEYNAFTTHDRTIYVFSVNHDGFEGALDRFSRFFAEPLFDQDSIKREMNAVHHEFEDEIENEALKVWRVLKQTGNQQHPNAVFSCGNLESLSNVDHQLIKNWFSEKYVAQSMNLVLLSPLSIKEMCELVVGMFSDISAENPIDTFYSEPFTCENQLGKIVHIDNSNNSRSLRMIWEMPKRIDGLTTEMNMKLIERAINHSYDNSLLSYLKSKDLVKDLLVDFWKVEKDHMLFLVEIELTKKGVREVNDVIFNVFQTINYLKRNGIPSYLHEELYLDQEDFYFEFEHEDPFNFVEEVASELVEYGLEKFPWKNKIPSTFDEETTRIFLNFLTPDNCVFFLVAPQKESKIKPNSVEKWMSTPYLIRDISEQVLQTWAEAPDNPSIQICPESDEDLDTTNVIIPIGREIAQSTPFYSEGSVSIHLSNRYRVEDDSICACFLFDSPFFKKNAKEAAMAKLLSSYLWKRLSFILQDAHLDGLLWDLGLIENKFCVILKVAGENKERLFHKFFTCLKNAPFDFEIFEEVQNEITENYLGDPDPLDLAQETLESILITRCILEKDVFHHLPQVTPGEFEKFYEEFFKKISVDGIFYGNISQRQALEFWKVIEDSFGKDSFFHDDLESLLLEKPGIDLDSSFSLKKVTNRKGNALVFAINLGAALRENWAAHRIVSQILQEEFFYELRTNQQVAYRLFTWAEKFQDRLLQYFAIQSSTHSPEDLLFRSEEFIHNFAKNFSKYVSKDRLNLIRYMLIAELRKSNNSRTSLEEQKSIHATIEKLKTISYEDIEKFVIRNFNPENKKRISILIEGR